jgi:hypothetical protein
MARGDVVFWGENYYYPLAIFKLSQNQKMVAGFVVMGAS